MDKKKRGILISAIAIVVVIVTLSVVLIVVHNNKSKNNVSNVEKQLMDITEKEQKGLGFANIQIQKSGATTVITGVVQNHKTVAVDARLKMKLYYESGNLGGIAETEILDLNPDEMRDFEMTLMGDYTVCDKYEIVVVDVIEK